MNRLLCSILCLIFLATSFAAVRDHAGTITIDFPDGEQIEVRAMETPRWRTTDTDKALMTEIYASLRAEAEQGSASAAWALSAALNRCTFAYLDDRALEAAIAHMYQTGEAIAPEANQSPVRLRPGDSLAQAEEDLFRRPHRFCRGMSRAQIEESARWLRKAADLGYPPAAMQVGLRLGLTNEALRLLEIAWRAGKYDAIGHLGRLYEYGSPGEREPDPIRGLAYLFLYHRLTQARLQGSTTPIRSSVLQRSIADLDKRLNTATPETIEAAMRLAKQALRDNPNCCHGF